MKKAISRFWFPCSIITMLVIAFMSNDLFIPSMPLLAGYFHVSSNQIQNSIAFWFYGAMSLQFVLGPLSDQYGRKPILILSAGILVLASLFCCVASSGAWFMLGRFLQGLGVSGLMVTAFSTLHEVYEKEDAGTKILGYVGFCTALSPLAGPLIGGYLASYLGWKANFWLVAAFAFTLMIMLIYWMPETLTNPQKTQWSHFWSGYRELLANKIFSTTVFCYGLLFFSGGAFLAVVPFICVDLLKLPVHYVGFGMMPMFMCYMLTSALAEKLEKRLGACKLISLILSVLAVVMLVFIAMSNSLEHSVSFIVFNISVYYLALGLVGPPLNNISLSQASSAEFPERSNKGSASAVLTVVMMLGSALGASFMGYWYDEHLMSIALVFALPLLLALGVFMFGYQSIKVQAEASQSI